MSAYKPGKGQVSLTVMFFIIVVGVFAVTLLQIILSVTSAAGVHKKIDLAYQISDEGSALSGLLNSRSGGQLFIENLGMYTIKDEDKISDSINRVLSGLGENYRLDLILKDKVKTFSRGVVIDEQGLFRPAKLTPEEESAFRQKGWRWPVDPEHEIVSSGIGMRKLFGECKFHRGVDIPLDTGTPVYAAADGTVVFAGVQGDFGKVVTIEHVIDDRTYYTYYGHLYHIFVAEGKKVNAGDKIALSGNTGKSTGPHLHFDMSINRGVNRNVVDICPMLGNPGNCYQKTVSDCVVASGEGGVTTEIPLPGAVKGQTRAEVRLVV